MKIANDITKTLMQNQISAMEQCKYENEGTERTAGSYMSTCSKSMLALADKDEEVFSEYSKHVVEPLIFVAAGILTLSLTGMKIHEKLKERHEKNKEIKEENKQEVE